jgi:hypothetical protein
MRDGWYGKVLQRLRRRAAGVCDRPHSFVRGWVKYCGGCGCRVNGSPSEEDRPRRPIWGSGSTGADEKPVVVVGERSNEGGIEGEEGLERGGEGGGRTLRRHPWSRISTRSRRRAGRGGRSTSDCFGGSSFVA